MPERNKASAKRKELIEIASKLFYEQGYGATGIKQIIDLAGIAKGTFYSHFSSKEELGLAWLRDRHQLWNQWLDDVIAPLRTPETKLLGMFTFLGNWMVKANFRGCAFINTCAETPDCSLRREVEDHKRELHENFQDLARQHKSLEKPNAASKQLGTTLYLLFEGSLLEAQIFDDKWPIDSAKTIAKSLLTAP